MHRTEHFGVADGSETNIPLFWFDLDAIKPKFHHCFLSALEFSHQTGLIQKGTSSLESSLTNIVQIMP